MYKLALSVPYNPELINHTRRARKAPTNVVGPYTKIRKTLAANL